MFFDFLDRQDFVRLERINFRSHGSYGYEQKRKIENGTFHEYTYIISFRCVYITYQNIYGNSSKCEAPRSSRKFFMIFMTLKFKFTSNLKQNMNDDDRFENILKNSTNLLVTECFHILLMQVYSIIESIVVVHSTCHLYDFILIVCSVLNCVIANVMIVNFSRQFFKQLNVNEINIDIRTRRVKSMYSK